MASVKRCIVIGATSGIGRAVALVLSRAGYEVGITGRRQALLDSLADELSTPCYVRCFDVRARGAQDALIALIEEMQSVDLIVVSAGVGLRNPSLNWTVEQDTLATNVMAFAAMCNVAWHHFVERGTGHLVGISSIAAIRGGPIPAYNASKAFASTYLEGLRSRARKDNLSIHVTDIKPGFVHTDMAKGDLFWVASADKAARQICAAIEAKQKHAYITRRWRLVAWLLNILPDWAYQKLV